MSVGTEAAHVRRHAVADSGRASEEFRTSTFGVHVHSASRDKYAGIPTYRQGEQHKKVVLFCVPGSRALPACLAARGKVEQVKLKIDPPSRARNTFRLETHLLFQAGFAR